jgi:hypothetical protein
MMFVWATQWLAAGEMDVAVDGDAGSIGGFDLRRWKQSSKHANIQYAGYASSFRYLPPRDICALAWKRRTGRAFAMLGHNRYSSPELYSSDPGEASGGVHASDT